MQMGAISGEDNLRELSRILHVEDEPDIQELVRIALGVVGGFEIEQADSGQAAIAAVNRRLPDMILLDQMMPNMSGDETLQELKKIPGFEKVVCVFLSAKVNSAEPEKRADGITTLRKPFDIAKLKGQLQAIWRENTGEA